MSRWRQGDSHTNHLPVRKTIFNRIMALEPRFMFDAAGAVTNTEGATPDASHPAGDQAAPVADANFLNALAQSVPVAAGADATGTSAKAVEAPAAATSVPAAATQTPAPASSGAGGHTVMFVDPTIADYQTLVDGALPGVEVVVLDPSRDGLDQMADYLNGRSGIDSIQIMAHGSSGRFALGSIDVNPDTLATHSDDLATIGQALTEGGDILIYACNTGAGINGQGFVIDLAIATGADVAASSDDTGSAALGGNWTLETRAGSIESAVALTAEAQNDYDALMTATFTQLTGTASPVSAMGTVTTKTFLAGDFDGDGDTDFIFRNNSVAPTGVDFWRNDNGVFTRVSGAVSANPFSAITWSAPNSAALAANFSPFSMMVTDVDGDGDIDVVNMASGTARGIWQNNGGVFTRITSATLPTITANTQALEGDFDGDGDVDIIIRNNTGAPTGVNFWRNDGGTFTLISSNASNNPFSAITFAALAANFDARFMFVGDVDGDGDIDIVNMTGSANPGRGIWLNNNGVFSIVSAGCLPVATTSGQFVAGDFDGDGDTDIAFRNSASTGIDFYRASNGTYALDTSANPFAAIAFTSAGGANNFNGDLMTPVDIDGDGDLDIVNLANTAGRGTFLNNLSPPKLSSVVLDGVTVDGSNPTGVDLTPTITLNFNKAIQSAGSGKIYIRAYGTDALIGTVTASDTSKVSGVGSGSTITITPGVTLSSSTRYYIQFDKGAFFDSDGATLGRVDIVDNSTMGLTSKNLFNFTTVNNTAPSLDLNGTLLSGTGNTVTLAGAASGLAGTAAAVGDVENDSANWNNATLTVKRTATAGTANGAWSSDQFGFTGVSGITVDSGNLMSGATTIGTETNSGGTLIITFNSNATTTLVTDVVKGITYANSAPAGNATITFALTDGSGGSTSADVTVTSANIYVTATTDTSTVDVTDGVSFSEAVAIANAQSGADTLVMGSGFTSAMTLVGNLTLSEGLTVNADAANGWIIQDGTKTITLNTGSTLTVTDSAGTVTINSMLAGAGGLIKAGAGTLILAGTNTYGGTTAVTGGTLSIGAATNIGAAAITLDGGTLASTGATVSLSDDVALGAGGGTVSVGTGNALTLAGTISGAGNTLTKSGIGVLTLSGTSNNTGWLASVTGGVLSVGAATNIGTGSITLDGGTLASTGGTVSLSNNLTLGAGGGTVSVGSGNALTLAGTVSGTGNTLTKSGIGSLILSGTSNNTGWLASVTGGALSVGAATNIGTGAITLDGGTLASTGATVTLSNNLTLGAGGGTVDVGSGNALTLAGVLSGSGALAKSSAGTLTLSGTSNDTGTTTVGGGTLVVTGTLNGSTAGTVSVNSGGTLAGTGTVNGGVSVASGGILSPGIAGSSSGVETLTIASGGLTIASGGTLAADIAGLGTYDVVDVTGAVSLAGTLSLSGSYAATKTASGQSFIMITNDGTDAITGTFSGLGGGNSVTFNGATLTAGYAAGSNSNDFQLLGPVNQAPVLGGSFTTAGTVDDNATTTPFSGVTVTDADDSTGTFTITIAYTAANGTLTSSGGGLTGTTGSYTLTASSPAALQTLLQSLQFTPTVNQVTPGGTVATTFTLTPSDGVTTGSANATTVVTATSINDAPTTPTLTGTSISVFDAAGATVGTLASTDADTGQTLTYSLVSGSGSTDNLEFSISGTSLSAVNPGGLTAGSYSVRVRVSDGTANSEAVFTIAATSALTVTTNNDDAWNGTDTLAQAQASNGGLSLREALHFATSGAIITFDQSSWTGSGAAATTITLGSDVTVAAGVTFNADIGSGTADTVTIASSGSAKINTGSALTLGSGTGDTLTISAILAGSTSSLQKTGAGTLVLTGDNSFTGTTTVSAGELRLNRGGNGGAGGVLNDTLSVTVASGATLTLSGDETIGVLSGAGTVALGTQALKIGGGGADSSFSGAITGASGSSLTQDGTGTLTLSGANGAQSWKAQVNNGTLSIGAAGNLGTGVVELNGATLSITADASLANGIALDSGGGTVSVGSGKAATLSGAIVGTGALTKTGAGTLTLSNSGDGYSGATTVSAGASLVTGALTGGGTVSVSSGATLGGTGRITTSGTGVTIASGAILAPGVAGTNNGIGKLTIVGNLLLNGGLSVEAGGSGGVGGTDFDQVAVDGTVSLNGGSISFSRVNGYVATNGTAFRVIDNDGTDAVSGSPGTFGAIAEGATTVNGSDYYTVSYSAGTGNDVTLTSAANPMVSAVSSTTANGTYKAGDNIAITVTFNRAVVVTGTPSLSLGTGRTASYSGGSGTGTLTFTYTVQAGDTAADLDYASTTALSGTIADTAGNAATLTLATPGTSGSLGAAKDIVIDTTAPVTPPAPVLSAASDSGSSSSDGITNVTTPTLTGTAEAGSTVTLYDTDGTTVIGTGAANGSGNYSIAVSSLSAGTHSITAKATDTGGNVSAASAGLSLTIDTVAPTVSAVSSTTANGTYKLGDSIAITVGFSEAVTVTGTPTLSLSTSRTASYSGGSGTGTLTFTYTVQAGDTAADLDYASTTALSGTIADTAGNPAALTLATPGASGSLGAAKDIVIETVAPTAPASLALAAGSDSGSSGSDRVTNVDRPTIIGTATPGTTVTVLIDGVRGDTTTAGSDGTWSVTLSTALANGVRMITTTATDAAGNTGPASAALALTVDTTAPALSVPGLAAGSDSGASASDRITNVTRPTLTGTTEAGSTVGIVLDGSTMGTTTAGADGVWSFAVGTALAEGDHSIQATSTDIAGNIGRSASQSFTIRSTLPGTPSAPALSPVSDSGASTDDRLTNVTRPTLTGTAIPNSTVTVLVDGTAIGTAQTDSSGAWSLIPGSALSDGTHQIQITVTDIAGNSSQQPSDALVLTVDTQAPTIGTGATISSLHAGSTVVIGAGMTLSDTNALDQLTVTLTNAQPGDELVTEALPGSITATRDVGRVVLAGVASAADYQVALQTIALRSSATDPGFGSTVPSRSITVSARDAAGNESTVATVTVPVSSAVTVQPTTPPTTTVSGNGPSSNASSSGTSNGNAVGSLTSAAGSGDTGRSVTLNSLGGSTASNGDGRTVTLSSIAGSTTSGDAGRSLTLSSVNGQSSNGSSGLSGSTLGDVLESSGFGGGSFGGLGESIGTQVIGTPDTTTSGTTSDQAPGQGGNLPGGQQQDQNRLQNQPQGQPRSQPDGRAPQQGRGNGEHAAAVPAGRYAPGFAHQVARAHGGPADVSALLAALANHMPPGNPGA